MNLLKIKARLLDEGVSISDLKAHKKGDLQSSTIDRIYEKFAEEEGVTVEETQDALTTEDMTGNGNKLGSQITLTGNPEQIIALLNPDGKGGHGPKHSMNPEAELMRQQSMQDKNGDRPKEQKPTGMPQPEVVASTKESLLSEKMFLREDFAISGYNYIGGKDSIMEAVKTEDGLLKVRLPVGFVEKMNDNQRFYKRSAVETSFNSLKEEMQAGGVHGTHGRHPETVEVDPDKISHLVTDAWIDKDNFVWNEWLVNGTRLGKDLQELFLAGTKMGVSIRGTGKTSRLKEDAVSVDKYDYAGTDTVARPSTGVKAGLTVPKVEVSFVKRDAISEALVEHLTLEHKNKGEDSKMGDKVIVTENTLDSALDTIKRAAKEGVIPDAKYISRVHGDLKEDVSKYRLKIQALESQIADMSENSVKLSKVKPVVEGLVTYAKKLEVKLNESGVDKETKAKMEDLRDRIKELETQKEMILSSKDIEGKDAAPYKEAMEELVNYSNAAEQTIRELVGYAKNVEKVVEEVSDYAKVTEQAAEELKDFGLTAESVIEDMRDYILRLEESVEGLVGYSNSLESLVEELVAHMKSSKRSDEDRDKRFTSLLQNKVYSDAMGEEIEALLAKYPKLNEYKDTLRECKDKPSLMKEATRLLRVMGERDLSGIRIFESFDTDTRVEAKRAREGGKITGGWK